MRSVWAAGMLLRRLGSERGIILLIVVLVGSTSFVFAAAPRLFNRVSDDALHFVAEAARPADRNLTLNLAGTMTPGTDGGVGAVRAHGDELAAQIPPLLLGVMPGRQLRVTTARFYVPNPPLVETHISLRYQDGVIDATRLVAGRWPVDDGDKINPVAAGTTTGGTPDAPPSVIEAALSTAEATAIGVKVGDRLPITLDGTDPLVLGTTGFASQGLLFRGGYRIAPAEVVIVGLFDPIDPDSELWYGDAGLLQVEHHGDPDNPIAYVTAYMAPEEYPAIWHSGLPFHLEWRFLTDPQLLDAGQVDQLQADLHRLALLGGSAAGGSAAAFSVLTGLPGIIDKFVAQQALAESALSIAALGPFGLAAGAMAMVAILLVRRRRSTLALTRGRGATGALVLGTQLWESTLIAGAAALLGLLLAVLVVPARANPLSPVLAVGVGATAVLLLVGANWPTARRSLGQLERDDAPVLRVPARRLVIEMTVVGIAIAATLLLRQRGLSIGTSGVAQVDPLLASVPVLSGLAAGILAVRLYPLPIRALGWLAARRRDIVPVLGLRTIGRQPASANLPILVLLLTAAFGAFSSVIAASLDHGQAVASYLDVGADYRVEKIGIGGLATAVDPAAVVGVDAVAPGLVDPLAAFVGAPNQRASIHLEAIDPTTYAQVTAGTPADPQWPARFVTGPSGDGLGTADNPIPAILSSRLPIGSSDLAPGATFQVSVEGQPLTFVLVERRASFPGIASGVSFAVVPFDWIKAAFGTRFVSPSVLWLRASSGLSTDLASEIRQVGDEARVVSRYDTYNLLHDAPFGVAIESGYGAALITAIVFMALTIIGAVILSAGRRTRDLAFLRTLGVTDFQGLALTVMEHAPPVVLAIVPGVGLGIAIAILCEPGLGLDTFVGATGVPLYVDVPSLTVTVVALVAVVAVAVAAGTWLSRRARMAEALRISDD